MNNVKIKVRNLYKIYGRDPSSALNIATDGIDKTEFMHQTNHVLALNNINMDIVEGNITVVMGLSGSGKSTLIRHLNRLIEPTAGEIFLDGNEVLTMNKTELRYLRRYAMSMVFQKFALLPHRTVLGNVLLAPETRDETRAKSEGDALRWIKRVGLEGFEKSYPTQLSGGMQQRVGLARALTSNADVMLMDEAFSALDPLIRTSMQDLLLELQRDLHKTIVFITHDLDEALKLADHLVVLKDGYIVQQGHPQEILLHPDDRYIEEFIQDINRARVLRVGSIMQKTAETSDAILTVDQNTTLEQIINETNGATEGLVAVTKGSGSELKHVGTVDIRNVYRALVRPELKYG